MDPFDFVVIGGGSAGYAAARTAVQEGLRVAVIDGSETLGGLCILRGCMPSKALIEIANRANAMRRAQEFGIHPVEVEIDATRVFDRKKALIQDFADYRVGQLSSGKFELIRGMASFLDSSRVAVRGMDGNTEEIRASSFLIATGSGIAWPAIPGLKEAGCITSDEALSLGRIPESLVVLGAGPVGLEMAHFFHGVGSRVTVMQRSGQILTGMDRDVADSVADGMRERGIVIYTDTKLNGITRFDGGMRVEFEHGGEPVAIEATDVLNALGRSPATTGLDLDRAGVQTDRGRILVSDTMESNVPGIFAAGDCCGPFEVVHVAISQGEAAARNAAIRVRGDEVSALETVDYHAKLFAVFSDPEAASVGLTEAEAMEQGRAVVSASYPFDDHGKSIVMGETHGFVKLIADAKTGILVGGAVVGPHASDLIHEVVVAVSLGATAEAFAKIPHYHPTLSEIWTYSAEEIVETIQAER